MEPFPIFDVDDDSLCCPRCDFFYLHQTAVEVWNRKEDEDVGGIRITQEGNVAEATGDNPSARRSGVSIAFECEECPCNAELVIFQHKGQTFIEWREAHRAIPTV